MSAVISGLTAAIALATMMMIVVVIAVGRTGCWRTMTMIDRNGSVEGAEMVVQDMVPFLREMAGIWEQTDGNLADCLASAADEIERLRDEINDSTKALSRNATILMKQIEENSALRQEINNLHSKIDYLRLQIVRLSTPEEARRG